VAIDTKNLGIEIGFSEKEQERPDYIAWIIKTLFVGISTLLLPSGGMLLHAATLVRDDAAVLILASSGGGKSTAAHRVPLPWIAPGDENALVIRDLSGHYQVHALSTSSAIATGGNQTWNIATPYPLQGIYILIQADDDHIIRCTQGTAAGYLNGSAQQALKNQKRGMNTEYKRWKHEMLFSVACQMAGTIPTFLLYATLTGNFWEEIEKCKVIRIGKSRLYL
jgi:SynChlorMet cassette protein ScmC